MNKSGRSWLDDYPEFREIKAQVSPKSPVAKKKLKFSDLTPAQQKIIKRRIQARKKAALTKDNSQKPIEVQLNLRLPRLPRIPRLNKLQKGKLMIVGSAVVVAVVGLIVLPKLFSGNRVGDSDVLGEFSLTPDYTTILPSDGIENTESKKLGYDPEKKVASFTDNIGGTKITVSQQPLPQNFKDNQDEELQKMAFAFSATEVINESNPKAYLGTSVEGPQTVIFIKKDLLIFIQSANSVDKSDWAAYITQLI